MSDSKPVRLHWMDSLRGFAIVLVILHHSTGVPRELGVGNGLHFPLIDAVVGFFGPYRMALLLVISGLLLPAAVQKPPKTYASGKLRKVLWPFVIWMVLTGLSRGTLEPLLAPTSWLQGLWHLWFLAVLLFAYTVGYLSRWLPPLFLAVASLGTLVLLSPDERWQRAALFFGSFFFVGAALKPHLQRIQNSRVIIPLLGVPALAIAVLGARGDVVVGYGQTRAFLIPWAGVVFFLWLWPRIPRTQTLELLGRHSIVAYTMHFPAQSLFAKLAPGVADSAPGVFVALSFGVGLTVPLLVIKHYQSFKWFFELPAPRTP